MRHDSDTAPASDSDPDSDPVPAQLAALGFSHVRWLASGMEADVYALDARTVARLPRERTAPAPVDLLLQRLTGCDLPFAVPAPLGHLDLPDGRRAGVQRLLPGRSVGDFYDEDSGALDPRAEQALLDVLTALHAVPSRHPVVVPDLPLMGGPVVTNGVAWTEPLRELLTDRLRRSGPLLHRHVDRVDDLVRAATEFLASRDEVTVALQHGDLCRENVLVDDGCRPTAVLAWGFLTMLADPAFELSLTAGFFDMHGPRALRTDRRLSDAFGGAFGVEEADLLRYRALYALLGANAYSEDADGHFLWCAAQLGRSDLRTAVLG